MSAVLRKQGRCHCTIRKNNRLVLYTNCYLNKNLYSYSDTSQWELTRYLLKGEYLIYRHPSETAQ